jgi:hypothetical protein
MRRFGRPHSQRLTGVRKSGEEAKNHVCGQNRLFAGRTTGTTLNEAQTDTKCIMAFRFLITNQTYTCQSKLSRIGHDEPSLRISGEVRLCAAADCHASALAFGPSDLFK